MSRVVASNLFLAFGERKVIDNISFRVADGDRIGLVGPNGSGKSTLLRILAGEMAYESGLLQFARNCQVGYLPQDILELPENTVIGSVIDSVPGKRKLEEKLDTLANQINESTDQEEQMSLAQQLADTQSRIDHYELHFSEHEALKILSGLGFLTNDMTRSINEFSGGWKMRIALACILFRKPNLILLDEPTNHLDFPSVVWFDGFLKQYNVALILVSHDRYFLNRQINKVMAFEVEGLRTYTGNFDQYRSIRENEEELLMARTKNVERERKELEKFVERFKAKASKARQAQSRVKMIERMEKKAPEIIRVRKKISINFPDTARTGYEVLKMNDLSKGFDELILFNKMSLKVFRGDRLAVVGKNGIGKTTLLKMIAGELAPDSGSIEEGQNVELRYYAQHQTEALNPHHSILEEVMQEVPTASQTFVRGVLGAFLFPKDEVEKTIQVLSGGEKARVALAKLLVKPGNFLLMDEPTNHLDVDSSEALASALQEFNGTLVFVSHNRSFVDHLATRVWDLTPDGIIDYPGNLERYLEFKEKREKEEQKQSLRHLEKNRSVSTISSKQEVEALPNVQQNTNKIAEQIEKPMTRQEWLKEKEKKRVDERKKRQKQQELRSLKKSINKKEKEIEQLEGSVKQYEHELANPTLYQNSPDRFNQLMDQYNFTKKKLEKLYQQWEKEEKRLENISSQSSPSGS